MALGLSNQGGGFDAVPYVKYDAKAGRMFAVERVQGPNGWENRSNDVTNGFTAAFDLENIMVGWSAFTPTGPNHALVRIGETLPAKPSDDHKQSFKLRIWSKSLGLRELAGTAKALLGAVDQLHDAYLAAPEAKSGKVPVVAMTGTTVVETKGPAGVNRNYAPVFAITKWIARPDVLAPVEAPKAVAPSSRAGTPVPPPADDDFGD